MPSGNIPGEARSQTLDTPESPHAEREADASAAAKGQGAAPSTRSFGDGLHGSHGLGREDKPDPAGAVRGMGALAACVLAADLILPPTIAVSVLYVLPVLLSLWLGNTRITRWSAILATAAIVAGGVLSPESGPLGPTLANRAVAVFAVWAVASLGKLRVEAETELRRSRETTRTTLASIAEGVIATDAAGAIAFLNPIAERLLGWRQAEAVGRPLADLFEGRDREGDHAHRDTIPAAGVMHVRRRDGKEIALETSVASVRDPEHPDDAGFGRVLVFRDVTARRAREAAVEALAYRDPLTGLANRQSFEDRLELELAHAERAGKRLGLVFLDLDGFKEINDTLGHAAGDQLLVAIARRLRDALREEDTVARLGGDEFTVLLPGLASTADAETVVGKLLEALLPPHQLEGREILATPSLGLAIYPDDLARDESAGVERRGQAARLVRVADHAMYAAKDAGGARWSRPRVAVPTDGG